MSKGCADLVLPLTDFGILESCPNPLLATVLRKAGPVSSLGSTVELVLVVEVWVSQPQLHEHGRACPTTHLS